MVARREQADEKGAMGVGRNCHGDVKYSIGNTVNVFVITTYGVR